VSDFRLAADSYVATDIGPRLTVDLEPGVSLTVAQPNGLLGSATVVRIHRGQGTVWRLLTELGDVVAPQGSRLITRSGIERAEAIADAVSRGAAPRLEVLRPSDLPRSAPAPEGLRDPLRACLASLERPIVQLPAPSADAGARTLAVATMQAAETRFILDEESERWTALTFERPSFSAGSSSICLPEQAEALLALTAWSDGSTSRTRLSDTEARRRLIAGLVAANRPFRAAWLPGYWPVECRVKAGHDGGWPPFVPVVWAKAEVGDIVTIVGTRGGTLVCGLTLVAEARGSV
jgi:hypothetical protein